jgi:uncharacterized protein (TIGR00106 family)
MAITWVLLMKQHRRKFSYTTPDPNKKRDGFNTQRSESMHVIVDFTVVPIGTGVSLSKYVAACERVLEENGLEHQLHANGTSVEGEWEDVFLALRRCHERLHAMGVPRIHTDVKIGTRTDRDQNMADKVASVQKVLKK